MGTVSEPDTLSPDGSSPVLPGEPAADILGLASVSASYHGGWLAENMYYLGTAGSVLVNGLRISGASGIYKSHDLYKGMSPPALAHRRDAS